MMSFRRALCVLLVALFWSECFGADIVVLRRRRVCEPGEPEGCASRVTAKKHSRLRILQCYTYGALVEGLADVGFQCPAETQSACVTNTDINATTIPEWIDAPYVRDVEEPFSWDKVTILIDLSGDESSQAERLDAVSDTWARRVNAKAHLVFLSSTKTKLPDALAARNNVTFMYYDEPYADGYEKEYAAFAYLLEHHTKSHYFIKVDNTGLLIPQNLNRFLDVLHNVVPEEEPLLFGKALCPTTREEGHLPCYVFGSYGMNRAALKLLVAGMDGGCHKSGLIVDSHADLLISKCLGEEGVPVLNCNSFRQYSPRAYLSLFSEVPGKARSIVRRQVLGGSPISFQNLLPGAMRFMDTYFYGSSKAVRSTPKSSISTDEVALEELENNCFLTQGSNSMLLMNCAPRTD